MTTKQQQHFIDSKRKAVLNTISDLIKNSKTEKEKKNLQTLSDNLAIILEDLNVKEYRLLKIKKIKEELKLILD